jgi:solute carrier family 20 (sodium-dependent phosphate transporter)
MAMSLGVSAARELLTLAVETTCKVGVLDCGTSKGAKAATCAKYDGEFVDPKGNYILLVFTVVFAAAMAFSIGGNDGANAWATSVHSFAIKLRPAVILAGFFEVLGASTLGYGVSSSIQKGISNISDKECFACGYCDSSMSLYYAGMMASLIGASTFLLTATYFRMPVSTTHAIVSAVLGMTVVYNGFGCVKWGWDNMGGIIASWVISPIMSGIFCLFVYFTTYYFIFAAKNSRSRA